MLAEDPKWGVPDDNETNMRFGHNSELLKPHSLAKGSYGHFKASRFHWYKPFGCAPPKALFYEATFSQNLKVEKSKIKILVGTSIFVVLCKSLLPTLGRSANLSEPWAPRKHSRSLVQCCT